MNNPISNLGSFVQNELSSLIVTITFLAALTILLALGVFPHDDVLIGSLLTLIASYWFTSAAHRAGSLQANVAGTTAVSNLLAPSPLLSVQAAPTALMQSSPPVADNRVPLAEMHLAEGQTVNVTPPPPADVSLHELHMSQAEKSAQEPPNTIV